MGASDAVASLAQQPIVRLAVAASIGAGVALWISGRTQKLMNKMITKAADSVKEMSQVSENVKETAEVLKTAIALPHMAEFISFMAQPVEDHTFRWEGQYNMVIDLRESLVVIKDIFNSPALKEHLERLCPIKAESNDDNDSNITDDSGRGSTQPALCIECSCTVTDDNNSERAVVKSKPDNGETVKHVRSILETFYSIIESKASLRWSNVPALLEDAGMQREFIRLALYVMAILLMAAILFCIAYQMIF